MNRIRVVLEKDAAASERLRLRRFAGTGYTISAVLAHSGDSWFLLLGLIILWLFGNDYWRTRTALFALGIGFLAVLVMAIKLVVRRRRPEGQWGAIYRNTDPHSFPSGHAARVVMLTVIALGIGPTWLAILLLIWAPMVSLSWVIMGLHYLSDILAGMALGIAAGLALIAVNPILTGLFPFIF